MDRSPQTSTAASMRRAELQAYMPLLDGMVRAWGDSGAAYFALTQDDEVLFSMPAGVIPGDNDLSVRVVDDLFIRVFIDRSAAHESRLRSDAQMLARLLALETDMNLLADELVVQQDQLLGLYDLNRALDQQLELRPSLAMIAAVAQRLTNSANAVTALEINGEFLVEQTGSPLTQSLLELAFETNRQVKRSLQPMLLDGGYMLCAPMDLRTDVRGVLVLLRPQTYLSPEIKLTRAVAEEGRTHLHNMLLYKEQLEQTRLQVEIELARTVQTSLLPHRPSPQPGIEVYGESEAAKRVGGDFYDFVSGLGKPFFFFVGDVAGKGLPAAMVMTMTRTAIRSATNAPKRSPAAMLERVNNDLYDDFTELGIFTTAFVARYDPDRSVLIYANAGHSPIYYRMPDGTGRYLVAEQTALGVLPWWSAEDEDLPMPPGALLVVATDGYVEAEGPDGTMFGYDRFRAEIDAHAHLSAEALARHLLSIVTQFRGSVPQQDDQTLIIFKRTENGP